MLKLGLVPSHLWYLVSQMLRVNTLANALPPVCLMVVLAGYLNASTPLSCCHLDWPAVIILAFDTHTVHVFWNQFI